MEKPSVFIGSSTEGLEIAREIAVNLQNDAETTVWNEGIFTLGNSSLESLVNALDRFDFAILVLTPDDLTTSRDTSNLSARDNVLFELGLFMGRLGRSRTFVVFNPDTGIKIPSDLAGITVATYRSRSDGNVRAALGTPCQLIRTAMRDLGLFEGKGIKKLQEATQQVENISDTMERLIALMARSRTVELDIISTQFGMLIKPDLLNKLRKDLKDLEESTKNAKS